jgi:hypothetical protein
VNRDDPEYKAKIADLEERVYQAFGTLRRLPSYGPEERGGGSSWPPIVRTYWEAYGIHAARIKLPPPSARAISDMETVLGWMTWLGRFDRLSMKCVFLCCGRGLEPTQAGGILGLHRNTVRRHRDDGLFRIVTQFLSNREGKANAT